MKESRPAASAGGPGPRPADHAFARRLAAWYRVHHRKLPWRETSDPYAIWVSEVMLQQTTVAAVIPYYERWMNLFPDPAALARAPLQKVLRAWQGLGYYRRARDLRRAAGLVVRRHGGRLPDDEQTLGRLPGFGPYTTAAVLSLAFDRPLPVIDANVRRVLMRISGLRGEASPRHDKALRAYLSAVFPARTPGLFNQAMMELGAVICRSRNPQCLHCPLREYCRAFLEGTQEIIPRPRRQATKKVEAVLAVIRNGERVLIQKRPLEGLFGGLWEFPGGKVEPGERPEDALRREVREELGAEPGDVRYVTTISHAYTQFRVTLSVFSCLLRKGRPSLSPGRKWVAWAALARYPMPSGSARVVRILRGRLSRPND